MALTKHDLYSLASVGMRQQLLKMEREIASIHKEFPDLFITNTAPQFVKLEAKKSNGNGKGDVGGWPVLKITPPEEERHAAMIAKQRSRWTPERRAAQARRMKKQMKKILAARGHTPRTGKKTTKKPTSKKQLPVWYRAYEYLLNAPDRSARLSDLVKALHVQKSATVITGLDYHKDVITRASPGVYQITRELSEAEIEQVRKSPSVTNGS